MAVLLIGSTGNGKSTLGNFILNPEDKHMYDNQTFITARSNLPETQKVHICRGSFLKGHDFIPLTLIDTPGLNESAVSDLSHMITVITAVQQNQEVRACVLVVKFNSKIDAQYKATVQYYSRLLPFLFETNVVIAMTDFATDERSEALRRRQRIDVEVVKSNIVAEVKESGGLSYSPTLFAFDCLPLSEEERKLSLSIRSAFLEYILSLEPIRASSLMFAKTPFLRSEDTERVRKLEGEINGYNRRLKEVNDRAKEALDKMQKREQELTFTTGKLHNLQKELADKDTPDTVIAENWTLNEEWKLLRWLVKDFDIRSNWSIQNVKKWSNGHCEWKDYKENSHRVKGRVQGHFMRGLYATITLETTKREKYEKDIYQLQRRILESEKLLQSQTELCDEIRERYKEHTEQLQLLEEFIRERRKEIKALSCDVMTIEEALIRLQELKQS